MAGESICLLCLQPGLDQSPFSQGIPDAQRHSNGLLQDCFLLNLPGCPEQIQHQVNRVILEQVMELMPLLTQAMKGPGKT